MFGTELLPAGETKPQRDGLLSGVEKFFMKKLNQSQHVSCYK